MASEGSFKRAVGLTIVSGFFFALMTATDNYVVRNVIAIPNDPLFAVFIYLILGSWIGVIVQFFFSNWFGKWIYKDFQKINFYSIRDNKEAIYSGLLSAVATMFALWGGQLTDPSVVVVLTNTVLVYLVIYDVFFAKTLSFKAIVIPALLIILGSILASLRDFEFSFAGIGLALLVLLIGRGLSSSASKIIDQRGARKEVMDPVNYAFWRFVWLAIFGSVLALSWSLVTGNLDHLLPNLIYFFPTALLSIVILMFFVTFANATEIAARKLVEISVVSLLVTFQVVIIIPITIIGNLLVRDVFGVLPQDIFIWAVRIIGIFMVIWGVRRLRKI